MLHHEPLTNPAGSPGIKQPPEPPPGAVIQNVIFVTDQRDARLTLREFAEPFRCRAVLTDDAAAASDTTAADDIHRLSLLLDATGDPESPELAARISNWLEPETPLEQRQGLLIALQGIRVFWLPGRAAIVGPPQRHESLRAALVEFALHEGEVRRMEAALAAAWPELEADAPLAFHFDEQGAARRDELAQRFQQVFQIRMRFARINPALHRAPVHPPTLAGQLVERLKERTRLTERLDYLEGQLEVFERIYDMCGQRSTEFALSRKETTLEWVIIVLLALETIVILVGMLAAKGS